MEKYHIELKLFYIRTLKTSKYKYIPDLQEKDFEKFLKEKNFIQKLFEDLSFLFENMFDSFKISNKKYNKTFHILMFDLTIPTSTIKKIKEILLLNSLEDSLYEDIDCVYSINDAIKYYKLYMDKYDSLKLNQEVGVFDYRKNTNILVKKYE